MNETEEKQTASRGREAARSLTTSDLRVRSIRPLIAPAILHEQFPLSPEGADLVQKTRGEIAAILNGEDDRLIAVVGPCSIHDPEAALDYAARLAKVRDELSEDLLVVMRVYFEKPRTTVGWKGLINDPYLDESYAVNDGLSIGRRLVLDLAGMGIPAATEFLDPITPQFFSDILVWSAIGARTTESQVHRQLASGLSMPVGFKNGTGGGVQIAVDAVGASIHPHSFLGVTDQGLAGIVTTEGNPDCHIILRGGKNGPNYDAGNVASTLDLLEKAKLPRRVMIDASHANSEKDYRNQPKVVSDISEQIRNGQREIVGVMMESFIEDGAQSLGGKTGRDDLTYGQSVTDSCMGWSMTVPTLRELASAVRDRRA
ncbi:3-deoxy-7-phosphoheptulonate synthase [Rubrobacter indicoceani]|uniref:3-deoxy-7-phosphoheptulonate synthase n=1 Tax=Rubrobacter indicoceani TaxID=2051957 RepID=UPI0023E0C888|nr:3-deoxy-7-phosphoheptulonate synthase [Rubrobacter indicoceani]